MKTIIYKIKPVKFIIFMILFTSSVFALKSASLAGAPDTTINNSVPGEILVQYKNHVSPATAAYYSGSLGSGLSRVLMHTPSDQGPIHLLSAKKGQSIQQSIANIQSNNDVLSAQPNYIYHSTATSNDTSYGQLWGLKNSGQGVSGANYPSTTSPALSGTAGKDINAEAAWNIITDCSSSVVAVIDTGVNYTQQDLTANMVNGSYTCPGGTGTRGCDFVGIGDADPMDFNGHGTHVAGIVGARGNNALGVTGVCQTAQILAVRVLDASGSGTTADIIEGINFAVGTAAGQGHAKVINMSLGGAGYDPAFSSAIDTASSNGVVVVVAAGNSARNHSVSPGYPCDFTQPNIICVTAVDQNYNKASFGDYDTASTPYSSVDIGAPGTNILSSYFGTSTVTNDYYNTLGLAGGGTLNWINTGGGWSYLYNNNNCLAGVFNMLYVPTQFCAGGVPANGLTNGAYNTYNLSTPVYVAIFASFYAWVDLTNPGDTFKVSIKSTGGDPFIAGTLMNTLTGTLHTGTFVGPLSVDLTGCTTTTCSIGFQYATDANVNTAFDGVGIVGFSITGQTITTSAYAIENGTSMASPYVAGIAAMVRARNPNFTYSDTVNAILGGGDVEASMVGKTKTGMVADAYGALKYIPEPTITTLSSP